MTYGAEIVAMKMMALSCFTEYPILHVVYSYLCLN